MNESRKSDTIPWKAQVRRDLTTHLLWAEERKLKSHRDNFIHGSTWDYAMPGKYGFRVRVVRVGHTKS